MFNRLEIANIIIILIIFLFGIKLFISLIIILYKKLFRFFRVLSNNMDLDKIILHTIPINNEDNIIHKINKKRDEIYYLIQKVANELEIPIECIKSSLFDEHTWVACSVKNEINKFKSKDTKVFIAIEAMPFHEYDVIIRLEIIINNYQKKFKKIIEFEEEDIRKILRILVSTDGNISYRPKRYSNSNWFFWRPENNLIKEYRLNAFVNFIKETFPFFLFFIFFDLFEGLYTLYNGHKSYYKVTMGKPDYEPRSLIKLDSWQTVVLGIGNEKEKIFMELQEKLSDLKMQEGNFQVNKEKIWYWGIDGKIEREQLACIFNRGYVFVHIYAYAEDLYIGWDANLNYGTWKEYKVAEGYTNGDIKNLELCSIKFDWRNVNEYDLDDTNFLLETVHSHIMRIIKRIIKEKEIDQEIDFTIVRESRKDALFIEKPKKNKKNKFKRLS